VPSVEPLAEVQPSAAAPASLTPAGPVQVEDRGPFGLERRPLVDRREEPITPERGAPLSPCRPGRFMTTRAGMVVGLAPRARRSPQAPTLGPAEPRLAGQERVTCAGPWLKASW